MKSILTSLTILAALAVSAFAAETAPIRLEGKFGRVEINPARPELESLTLRRADGTLEPHSLLSPKGVPWMRSMPAWATQALTFAVDETGRRFESRNRAPESVEKTANGITLRGVTLTDGAGEPVAKEDWTLKTDGADLVWTVERTWLRELTTTTTGTPALFFSSRPINGNPSTVLPNAVATTFWIAPDKLSGWFNPFYRPGYDSNDFGKGSPMAAKLALENNVVVTEPGGWATLKLFTTWQNDSELRFGAEGGHLYRRGHFGWLSEAGIVSHPDAKRVYKAGEKEKTTLRLRAVPAAASGHQLAVKAEDPSGTLDTLCSWYGALFNGGCVNDQVHYNFGNEPDGWYYGGGTWMKGLPFLAGAPAPDAGSSRPHELPRAFRDNLQMILGTEFEPGRTRFGYNTSGAYTDDNIIQVIGGRAYHLYSGDIAFVRQNLPFYRRAVAWYLGQRNADGLVSMSPAHWYYDAMPGSGVTSYHNAFLYRALLDLAGMERAAGNIPEAVTHEEAAAKLKEAFNRVLWWEDAPGGPRYCDWITPDGTKIAYAADLCQFPPVAFGIASPEQGKKLIATIDKRIAELERENGYAGYASRSAYWPVPVSVNSHPANQRFGSYMNGGSFLCMTYWEIMARAAAGDAEGAWKRLQKFAEGTRLTGGKGFIGNNWVMENGRIGYGAGDEPFLSDAIAVPGALMQGLLGIRHTNDALEVNPVLPAALQKVSAEVVHLGMRKRVTIDGKNVKVEELGRAFTPPAELTWGVHAGTPPEAALYIDRTFETGSGWTATPEIDIRPGVGITLKRISTSPLRGLWKLDDAPGDTVADGSESAASGRIVGKVGLQSPDRYGKPGAARFQDGAHIAVGNVEPFAFKPTESFTIQAWFQTDVSGNQVIAARIGAYSLGVKDGKLSAWLMQDGGHFVEATGVTAATDAKWHHASAVFDRSAQTLTLYLDGKPDGVPQSIAGVGASSSPSPLTLGSFGGSFPFNGALDEIAIHRAALTPGVGVALKLVSKSLLRGLWKLDDAPGDTVADGSESAASGRIVGKVGLQSPDRYGKPGAARFQDGAHIAVGNVEPFAFKPTESFTIQAWFQTDVSGNQVIAARIGAYSLGVKDGKLSAWLMQDGGHFVEATGVTAATDAKWHHASAVFDRSAQTLTLYLDGKPDGVPQSIAGVGASSSPSPLTLGSFGGSFPFNGALDEIAIHRAALTPDKFATATDYAAHPPARLGAQTGRYTTTTCDWGQAVRLTKLRTTAALHDGTIIARVETSHDGFKTVAETRDVPVNSGDQATSINGLKPAPQARLVVTLATPTEATVSPVLKSLKLAGEPTP